MNKNKRNLIIAFSAIALAVAVLIVVISARRYGGGEYEPLPVMAFAESPRSYAGNIYAYEGHIDTQIGFAEQVGRVILTHDINSSRTVPVFISSEITGFSPNPGQLYRFVLKVEGDGALSVSSFKKL